MADFEAIVIGAGVVGLAVAMRFAEAGQSVLVLEKGSRSGEGVSSRNSGVIHAGIYYPPKSLKARFSVAGNRALYAFCIDHHVSHRRLGKWVVAVEDSQVEKLEQLQQQGTSAGVTGLELKDGAAVLKSEPSVQAVAGLWVPSSGIVDVPELVTALEGKLQKNGGMIAFLSPVLSIEQVSDHLAVRAGKREVVELTARRVINAAGLGAQDVAASIEGLDVRFVPKRQLSKGNYFKYLGKSPFEHLVYPVPAPGGLGVHATLDMENTVKFGPDVEASDSEDYTVDESRKDVFVKQIRRYFPALNEARLMADFAGIRPKIVAADKVTDFRISTPSDHGVAGLYNLFGIESPGLTAALPMADYLLDQCLSERHH